MSLDLIIATGTYTGNGATQSIAIGWQPAIVMTFDTKGGTPANKGCGFKTPDMADDDVIVCSSSAVFVTTNGLTITSTGFDLGSDVRINSSGTTFHWIALRAGPWLDTGTYTGNDPTAVTVTTGRQPDVVLAAQVTGTIAEFWKTPEQSAAVVSEFVTAVADVNGITIQSTGFEASANANDAAEAFDYAALYALPGSTRHFETGSYTGTGSSFAVALGRQPKAVFIFETAGDCAFKAETMTTTDFGLLSSAYSFNTTGGGPSITSTGFTTGTIFSVSLVVYNWIAFYE